MNRTPIVLSLFGLGFSVLGGYMMLRLLMPAPEGGMRDHSGDAAAGALRHFAGPDILIIYILMTAAGFAIFAAGLAILCARRGLS